jgi:glycosyltransferase involved in cell wall biosynthesis
VRLLIVTQYFWPENFRINDLVTGLLARGHDVTVLTGKPNYPAGRFFAGYSFFSHSHERYGEARVVRVPLIPRGDGSGLRLLFNYLSFALFASLLGPIRCRDSYDAVFVFEPSPVTVGLPALLMKKIKRAPLLFWVQDLWPESLTATGAVRSSVVIGGVVRLVRLIYGHCDRILIQSMAFSERIMAFGGTPQQLRYFPNTAEAIYRPVMLSPKAPEREKLPAGFRLVFAGNLGAAQSFETILGAAQRLSEHNSIQWIILGDGRLRPWIESQIHERGLAGKVHLLGQHPIESMPRFFALADALLVTLKRDPIFALTIPSKVQSYLACGRPIIGALDGEGARIIEESGAGLVAPAEDPAALARVVESLYVMPREARERMGASGLDYFAKHFSRELLIAKLEGWLTEVARREPGCAS